MQAPHENISKWVGALYFNNEKEPTPVGMNQFILRGCTLRNTDWIIGIVVFTGVETKISLNNKETKFKRSNVWYIPVNITANSKQLQNVYMYI